MSQVGYQAIDKEDGSTVLQLTGALTIQNISEMKKILLEVLERANTVRIDCSFAEKMDFSWLQLLCSAHRSALVFGKSLVVEAPYPDGFHAIKAEAGFDRHCSCPLSDREDNCIWVGIGHE